VQIQFGPVHQLEVFRVFQKFHQAFGFGLAGFDAEQEQTDFMFEGFGILRV
jgi:hypothetical protein